MRGSAYVKEAPTVTIRIDATMRVHEPEILRLVVGGASRGEGFGDKTGEY